MRKAVLVLVGVGLAALTLSGCAPASSGAGGAPAGGSSARSGAPAAAGASAPTGKIDLCSTFTPAALSSASGKSFSETVETDSDGVYGCAYQSSSDVYDWVVAVREPSDGDTPSADGLDLGGPTVVKKLSAGGYTGVSSPAGVELQVGKDTVEVYTPSTDPTAQATTDQFVTVLKALIAAVSK